MALAACLVPLRFERARTTSTGENSFDVRKNVSKPVSVVFLFLFASRPSRTPGVSRCSCLLACCVYSFILVYAFTCLCFLLLLVYARIVYYLYCVYLCMFVVLYMLLFCPFGGGASRCRARCRPRGHRRRAA